MKVKNFKVQHVNFKFFRIAYLFSVILLILFGNVDLYSQEKLQEIPLENIKGSAIGNNQESIGQIINRAVNHAKIEALKKVGIEENISSYTDYFKSENNNSYEELFTSDILSDINGAVKNVEILDTIRQFNEYGQLSIQVRINCTVIKYLVKKDLSFNAWINGIKAFYPNETSLNFSIKTTKDAFVNIFIFNEEEAYVLYPNDYEKSYLLKNGMEYNFPSKAADYILFTKKKSEVHRMIIVLTKQEIQYTEEVEYQKIIDWIFSIPPDLRLIRSFGFTVIKENKV